MFAGFSVGGVDWPEPEVAGVTDPYLRRQIKRQVAFQEAAITRQLGGNLLRVFFTLGHALGEGPEKGVGIFAEHAKPVYMHTKNEQFSRLDQCDSLLDRVLTGLAQGCNSQGAPLNLDALDDYIEGVEQYNEGESDSSRHVRILLTQVEFAPRWLIETLSDATLHQSGRRYTFASLWSRYLQANALLLRFMVRRYVTQRSWRVPLSKPAVTAFEICNEPDYEWIPDEMRIERAANPHANPLSKYITELQLRQIPKSDVHSLDFEINPWGYVKQDGAWSSADDHTTSVLDFNWGPKFDWYIKCYADFQEHMSFALRNEASKATTDLLVISGGVTHNNVDYLVRIDRANPNAFTYVDKIALHPYHWPFHDIQDSHFVSDTAKSDWMTASPRDFAYSYFKRFDFLEEIAALTIDPVRGRGLFGKKIWITEFGIPTKKLGKFNTPIKEVTRFIRERSEPELPAGLMCVIWEDLWDAFFDQVDAGYLHRHGVEAIVFYTLREAGTIGYDKDDDDRSNLSVAKRDGTPRMAQETFQKFEHFMVEVTGQPLEVKGSALQGSRAIKGAPWRTVKLPPEVLNVTTMLSVSERALLYWLARDYYTGVGKIVDGGCFVGGSTLSLAHGLIDGGHAGKEPIIHTYDLFTSDSYMVEHYFKPLGIKQTSGESFRPHFDNNTRPVSALLKVNEGDILQTGWPGDPIEILFIDISKHWVINDMLLTDFFPRLIPGRSIVIQQDFVFEWCPWLALTMEYLSDYFEFIAFVEQNSTVYLLTRPIPMEVLQVKLWELPLQRRLDLMDGAIRRFVGGYPKGVMECAKAALLHMSGQPGQAIDLVSSLRKRYPGEPIVQRAAEGVDAAAREALARS